MTACLENVNEYERKILFALNTDIWWTALVVVVGAISSIFLRFNFSFGQRIDDKIYNANISQ